MNSKKETEKKPLEFYLNLNYPITMYPEEEGGFTVEVTDLPGCLSQGETVEEAFEMITEARELWLETAYEDNVPIPIPSTEAVYSGKTMLRMPKYLHEKLARNAKKEEISLNQYIVSLLSERNILRSLEEMKKQLIEEIRDRAPRKERAAYLVGEETEYATSSKVES